MGRTQFNIFKLHDPHTYYCTMGKSPTEEKTPSSSSESKATPKTPKNAPTPPPPSNKKPSSIPIPQDKRHETSATDNTTPAVPTKLEELAQDLQSCNWDQLQDRFTEAMSERSDVESALQKETAELLEVSPEDVGERASTQF